MKRMLLLVLLLLLIVIRNHAQSGASPASWKTWLIASGADHRLSAPPSYKKEIEAVLQRQQRLDSATRRQILFWNAGAPGYRWNELIGKLWMTDTAATGALSQMLLHVSIYDATVAAWNTKGAFPRPRPFAADGRIRAIGIKPETPSYPCEHSVAAGAASTVIAHFYPAFADSVKRMALRLMDSRVAAGMAFPSDTRAGFELGRRIAEAEIERTKEWITRKYWDGKRPDRPGIWNGKQPMMAMAGANRPMVLESASEFRPGPPPDFAKDMAELKAFKQTSRSQANAWYYATQPIGTDLLSRKLFEYNLHLDPPAAARIYAAVSIAYYDAFISCFDAKYAYWGIRPDQYDTTYKPLVATPPFPGYPSGHAAMSGVVAELFSYFFPADRALFEKTARDGAESRFHAGIHFRTDNEVGLDLGRKVAGKVINRLRTDGADAPASGGQGVLWVNSNK